MPPATWDCGGAWGVGERAGLMPLSSDVKCVPAVPEGHFCGRHLFWPLRLPPLSAVPAIIGRMGSGVSPRYGRVRGQHHRATRGREVRGHRSPEG